MSFKSPDTFVHCHFLTDENSQPDESSLIVEAYFAKTKDFSSGYSEIENFVNSQDKLKADKLHIEEERYTYLFCHTLLRLVLSGRLKINPEEIPIVYDRNNKPWIQGNPLFFNISHTREAFAFVISKYKRVGVDLEKVDRKIDLVSISKRFFSREESEYILESQRDSTDRFFLLWTRKEALLKALGTGIITKISQLEVFRQKNIFDPELFGNLIDDSFICDHFIYSKKILDYYISIAVPQKSKIIIHQPDTGEDTKSNYLSSLLESFK